MVMKRINIFKAFIKVHLIVAPVSHVQVFQLASLSAQGQQEKILSCAPFAHFLSLVSIAIDHPFEGYYLPVKYNSSAAFKRPVSSDIVEGFDDFVLMYF